ncbi:MAG TPA: prolyl oligopeptidase family serine peptidase, partial [Candidatus Nanopelagicales bacterium]|nr:prolyl oligopeptidase family serine peptidase [Candidatus Nanopelagicales bacterium]
MTAHTTAPAADSYPRQAARTRGFRLGVPRAVTVSPDDRRVVFLRSSAGDDPAGALLVVDTTTEQEQVVADPRALLTDGPAQDLAPAEAARRERMRETTSGIVGYSTDEAVRRAAFTLAGGLYVVALEPAGAPRRLEVPGPVLDPRLSPDGEHIAYVVDGAVRVVAWDGQRDAQLVGSPEPTVAYGLADFVAAEELGRHRGLWWSPDSDALLVERYDEADVPVWWIADPAHPDREPRPHRYPAAGTTNPAVSVHLLGLDGSNREITWDHDEFPYLADVSWTVDGDPLLVLLDRPQRRRRVLAVDPVDAGSRLVTQDDDPHWVDSHPGLVRWAPDGRLLMVGAHYGRDDDWYAITADGVRLGEARANVRAILDVGTDGTALLAMQTHSSRVKLAVLDLSTGAVTRVTGRDAWEAGVRGRRVVVVASTDWRTPGVTTTVHRADGTTFTLSSHAPRPVTVAAVQLGRTVLLTGERELPTVVLFPTGHRAGSRRLPVVLSPYGGPGHSEVVAALGHYGEQQWLADQGFAVVVADGRGTPGHGPRWERAVAGDLASFPLQDQVDALAAVAAAFPADLDPTRVGIRGWSFGGYLAALAVLRRPDVFHAAVAGAPVTDWRRYDTAYTERYLGHPDEAPAAYDASSLLADAPELTRPLLLIHGMTDDNVAVAHSLTLSAALTVAGRPHTFLPLSGVTHMTP